MAARVPPHFAPVGRLTWLARAALLTATWLTHPSRGLPADKLAEASGVADAVFCHNGRFICGAKSREGAVRLAEAALAQAAAETAVATAV